MNLEEVRLLLQVGAALVVIGYWIADSSKDKGRIWGTIGSLAMLAFYAGLATIGIVILGLTLNL